MTIWKFRIPLLDSLNVMMPKGAKLLHVAEQFGDLYVWAEVDEHAQVICRCFEVYGTGHRFRRESTLSQHIKHEYVGTVHLDPFVWHIYDCGEI